MVTGMGNGLTIGVVVFIFFKGNLLTATFTTTPGVIQQGYNFLKGFALETIVTAVLFSMVGYFNGHDQTLWVMTQGLIKTFLIRLPLAY
ncbi:MATE family efflux transporter [Sharpea azabuensis]|uniref:MATE family efflux transporter n=1 Tax=Sharpea azabuensis TaxID=322505 RepID=UPI002E8227CB|nr:MATE family efflux transporter [Sharpea azabuensis]MEE3308577.1 MATE family efflux transporter [Sharpea azabuensis]